MNISMKSGFTIVELLIVVVVLAILAAITTVTYSGMRDRADESAVKADLYTNRNFVSMASETNEGTPAEVEKDCQPVGKVNSEGIVCLAAGASDFLGYQSTGDREFTVVIGRGAYGYSINQSGQFTKEQCTPQPNSTGSPLEYICPADIMLTK